MSSQFQNKLLHYEVQPPAEVWNRIAASLDGNTSITLSEKLYEFEEIPPPEVWQRIELQLNEPAKETAKIIPFFTRYRRPLKYSGAVAIFVFLAIMVSLLSSKKTESELTNETVSTSPKKDTNGKNEKPEEAITTSVSRSLEKDRVVTYTSKRKTLRSQETASGNSFFAENFLPRIAERNAIVNSTVPSEKYMIYSDGDGNAIRLPKKIFSAFACPVDNFDCKQRLKHLKEKFASAALTSDFTGLLEILKSLQENQ